MRNIRLIIEYEGTNYCGWQKQKNGNSVQHEIEKALYKVLKQRVRVIGSGRTDSGVHAFAQAAHFKTGSNIILQSLHKALNRYLPDDIAVIKVKEEKLSFHARYHAKSKTYRYVILNSKIRSPLKKRFSLQVPYKLNLQDMKKAAAFISGKRDFSSFKSSNSSVRGSVRTIKKIHIKKKGDIITIDIESDGFLYNMVRAIVGTLIDVGRNRFNPENVKKIVSSKNRSNAGNTVPAKGLFLMKVRY